MDLSCIISSGDLELYLLGMLPADEANKIEQLASLFPEIRQELDRISETLEDFARAANRTPSDAVKGNLMEKLRNLKAAEPETGAVMSSLPQNNKDRNYNRAIPVARSVRNNWLQAASVIGLIIAVGIIIFLSAHNSQNKKELAALEQKVNTINRHLVEQQRQNLASAEMLKMFESEQYKKIRLVNVPGKPTAAAQLFWNTDTKEVYIADISLPHTPAHKQYQLWAIVDGKPVDAGMMEHSGQRIQRMKVFSKADAFAITLERKGGSPTPTMEEMYVMGKAS